LPIWRDPLAKIKITGLAYPPTTGLSSINYKIMDKHIYTDDASSFYCENPLVLPQSLWCFDPMEDIEYCQEPPAVKNKFFTFGCFGNVAKITSKILTCWSEILNRVPDCHLLIQSTTLVDEATKSAFELKLINHNIPQERLQLRGPTFGGDFWATYREIDIVLDTYPFNGGTTSCFAAYAGVPVLTIAGKSLISRVGKSIMSNMGYSQFVVEDYESYIEKAVEFADSLILISQFRKDARKNFKATSLGDGKKFATDFEEACETILNKIKVSPIISTAHVPPLPKEILLNRAKTVWYYGNTDAADRILSCCLKSYPNCGGAFILKARKFLRDGDLNKAINLIKEHFDDYSDVEAHEAMLLVAHIYLLQDNFEEAANSLERQRQLRNPLPMHEWEAQLLWLACGRSETVSDRILATPEGEHHLLVCIPSPDAVGFEALKNHLTTHCICPKGWTVAYLRCDPEKRLDAYNDALTACEADTLILLQRNLKIHNPDFYIDTVVALQSCDVLGCAGATRWAQKDWALDLPQYRAWGLIRPSSEVAQMYELQVAGTDRRKIVTDAAVLDGKFLALKPATFSGIEFDTDLSDVQWLAEEDWSNRVHEAGYALHIHRNLGIMLGETLSTRPLHTTQGQERLINRLKLNPLAITVRDFTTLYIPVKTPENGYQIANCFFV
jgi:tetratricopeptide (TPR) repeat protein